MALGRDVSSQQFSWIIWIFTLLWTNSAGKKSQTFYMDRDCDKSVLLGGATIFSHHGDSREYSDHIDCRITFRAENDSWRLMMQVEQLDIPDTSYNKVQLCNDALYVYDAKNIFGRAISEAGGTGGLCGSTTPLAIYSSASYLTLYFRTDLGGTAGRGFKLLITAFNEDYTEFNSCGDAFQCTNHLCISRDLLCDGINHCGDASDELPTKTAQCGTDTSFIDKILSFGITAAIAITVGTVVVIVVVVVCIVCCCCRCKNKRQDPAQATTTTTATSVTINNGAPIMAPHPAYPVYNQQGYYPISAEQAPSTVPSTYSPQPPSQPIQYSPYPQRESSIQYPQRESSIQYPQRESSVPYPQRDSNSYSQGGSVYSSHPPPSYHRSYTPTSSKSGRSHQSSDNMVKYHHVGEKVAFPVHL